MKNVTGARSTTVVTLSRNALTTAVTMEVSTRSAYGRPSARRTASTAIHWKTPVFAAMFAMTIIPASRRMTLRSTNANASFWSTMRKRIMSEAPRSAASVRWIFSVTMSA